MVSSCLRLRFSCSTYISHMVAPPVLSESKTVTCSPRLCNSSANAIDVVVFPEPPLMIATVMMTVWFLTLMFWFPFSASGVDGIMVGVCFLFR